MKFRTLIALFLSIGPSITLAADQANPNVPPEKPDKVVRSKATGNVLRFKTPEEAAAAEGAGAGAGGKPGEAGGAKKGGKDAAGGNKTAGAKKDGAGKKGPPKKDKNTEIDTAAASAETARKIDEDDNIEMLSGEMLYGKIHKELPESVIMLIRKEQARVNVPRENIKALNYSVNTRLASLDKDDIAGQYKVGMWAMERSMWPDAIKVFEVLKEETYGEKKKEGAGPELLKQLAMAYDQRGQLDKALENYTKYAEGHPDDAEVADAIKRIDPLVNIKPAATAAAEPAKIYEGLEADGKWQAETWAIPTTAGIIADKLGNKMVAIQSQGGTQDKLAFSRYGQPLNLAESTEMQFKAFNDGDKPINLAVAFVNAEGDFHESHFIRIPPKTWTKESMKIDSKTFKSNRNDFKEFNQEIKGREHIARMTFMVYDQRPVKLFIDSLFFK